MTIDVIIIVQLRGPSILKNGILSVGIKTDTENKRITFKKCRSKLKDQSWSDAFKKKWDIKRETKDILNCLEMEAYEPIQGIRKIREYFSDLLVKYEYINITSHPEDIGALSNYMDYYLEDYGFFRNPKFRFMNFIDDKSKEIGYVQHFF